MPRILDTSASQCAALISKFRNIATFTITKHSSNTLKFLEFRYPHACDSLFTENMHTMDSEQYSLPPRRAVREEILVPTAVSLGHGETSIMKDKHHKFMRLALEMAEQALQSGEVPVGCVIVHDDQVIGRGLNDTNASLCGHRHAEFLAIEQILEKYSSEVFHESDLYVTVEPCVMCASALRQIGIRSVFFGAANDRFGGCGSIFNVHNDCSPEKSYKAYPGFYRAEAVELLRRFYTSENTRAPTPQTKKTRTLKSEIEPMDYSKYITEDEFVSFFGSENLHLYHSGHHAAKRVKYDG